MVIPLIISMPTATPWASGGSKGVDIDVKELELDTPEGHSWTLDLRNDYSFFGRRRFVIHGYLWKDTRIADSFVCEPSYHVIRHYASRVSNKYVKALKKLYNRG